MKKLAVIVLALAVIPTSQAQVTIVAEADAHIRDGSNADSNYDGADVEVYVSTVNNRRKGYWQFDLSSYSVDLVQPATLTLTLGANGPTATTNAVRFFGYNASATDVTLDETTLTWNNAPANNTGSANGFTADATQFAELDIENNKLAGDSFTVSIPDLSLFLQDNERVVIMAGRFNSPGANGQGFNFASKENAQSAWQPTLTFFTVVPEPSSAALLGLGLAVSSARLIRRRS